MGERGLLMLSLRLMPTPTSCMEDTMVLDMDTTDIPMLTMARGLLMLNQRLMLTPTSSMVDTMVLDTMGLDMDITDILMLIMARGLLMLSLRLMLILIFSMVILRTWIPWPWLWLSLCWLRLLRISYQPKRKNILPQKRKIAIPIFF